jgi:ribokinase
VVVAQLEVPLPAVEAAAVLAGRHGVPFVLNPAPAQRLSTALLRRVDTLTPNSLEAEILTGMRRPEMAAAELRRRGCRRVVLTLGAKGALACDESGVQRIAAPRIVPVDTVGAGDCFSAWMAMGLAEGLDLVAAVRRSVRAASLAVMRSGTQAGMPRRDEVLFISAAGAVR